MSPLSRRGLLRAAGVSAGAMVTLGGCGGAGEREAQAATDVELLAALIDHERGAVAGYAAVAERLRGTPGAAARRFGDHEREHLDRLALLVRELGGRVAKPRERAEPRLPRGERAALRYATRIEDAAIVAYLDALPRLQAPEVRAAASAILTAEAEHLAVLRDALGEEPAPRAFVDGTRP